VSRSLVGNKDLDDVWALWVVRVCNFAPKTPGKPIIV
jgi:hypothetical protein